MNAFQTFAILYFLLVGLINIGLTFSGFLPRSKEDYVESPKSAYYLWGSLMIAAAFFGVLSQ